MDQVDDPVDRAPRGPVDLGGQLALGRQAGVGDLGDQGKIVRPGAVVLVIADRPPHDAAIGLGIADSPREPDRLAPGTWYRSAGTIRSSSAPQSSSATRRGRFWVILATSYPLMRWNRLRDSDAPDSIIASYPSTVMR